MMSDFVDAGSHPRCEAVSCDIFGVDAVLASLLQLTGELDAAAGPMFSTALRPLIDDGGMIGVDLAGLTFMDCAGISALSSAAQALGDRGRVVIFNPSRAVRRLFELTGLSTIVDIDEDLTTRTSTTRTTGRLPA